MENTSEHLFENDEGFKALFEHATLSILVADESGMIRMVNPGTEKLFGYSKTELSGQPVELLIPVELHGNHRQYRDQYFSAPQARPMGFGRELLARHKDGRTFPVEISLGHYKLAGKKMAVAYITDISERKRQEEVLRVREETTRLIMNSALDAIICIDTNGRITVWNPQAEKIFGWKEQDVRGRLLSETIIPLKYREAHESGLKHYLQTGHGPVLNKLIEITALNVSGKEFPIELTIVPINQDGTLFFCAFLRDITGRKTAEERQKQYANELKQKNIELEQFAYVVSHDLQEPLRTVSGFVDLLRKHYKGKEDEVSGRYINFITEASQRMRNLVKDLLDYSRLGRERKLEFIDCNDVVQDVLSDLAISIRESGAVIDTKVLPKITGYRTEIKQLFQNLLSNSLKFRRKNDPPIIEVFAEEDPDFWKFTVRDNGIGINKLHWERIFVIFQRLHLKNEYEGTGIGLAHCKKIVELHEGRIWLESQLGKGTDFFFTIKKLEVAPLQSN
jgi:PAS domain S-box-containing protein